MDGSVNSLMEGIRADFKKMRVRVRVLRVRERVRVLRVREKKGCRKRFEKLL